MRSIFFITIILGVLMGGQVLAQDAEEILERVQDRLESINAICADYEQTFHWELAGETNVVSGTVCVKEGIQFRIENPDQIIVTDGNTLWTLSHTNRQVVIDQTENNTPENPFLTSFLEKYNRQYNSKRMGETDDTITVLLTARTEDVFQRKIELTIEKSSSLITRVVQTDVNDNQSIYELKNIDTDPDLTAAAFTLDIPEGYKVSDMRP
jgi:chaperone LolA